MGLVRDSRYSSRRNFQFVREKFAFSISEAFELHDKRSGMITAGVKEGLSQIECFTDTALSTEVLLIAKRFKRSDSSSCPARLRVGVEPSCPIDAPISRNNYR